MKKSILILCLLSLSICCFSQKKKNSKIELKQTIDNYLKQTIQANEIPGLAVGIVKDGKIIFEAYYGKETLEENNAINKNTLFRIYSTSKLISTVGIFQLIEKSNLSLEDEISKYIENLPKEWQKVKIKNLLTHSSGIPNTIRFNDILATATDNEKIERLSKEKMEFKTGNQFSYNQTNYWLLTMIIEKITGQTFEDFIIKNQFSDTDKGIFFSSNSSEIIANRVVKYFYNTKIKKYEKTSENNGFRAHSGNGVNITLQTFLNWSNKLDKNILLNSETKKSMWQPFQFNDKKSRFGYGWDFIKVNNKESYGFSGGNVSAYRKFEESNMSIIVLSNGYKFFPVQDQIINHIAGLVDKNLMDEYLLSNETIIYEFLQKDNSNAEKEYHKIKSKNKEWNFENTLNSIGYILVESNRLNDAIKVFELNTRENPNSGNAYDSLAESYLLNKNNILALEKYKKSFELDPNNDNAKKMIFKIENLNK